MNVSLERNLPGRDNSRPQPATLSNRIDTYLLAAGVEDRARRRSLCAATLGLLAERGAGAMAPSKGPTWAEIIAAIDTCLTAETCTTGSGAESARGRVTLKLGPATTAQDAAAWGTPPRRRRRMRAQSLSLWRPQIQGDAAWLYRYQISRSTQSLAACLCWLAVLIIP